MNKTLEVNIHKITIGKDGKIYLVVGHPCATNHVSLLINKRKWGELKKIIYQK